MSIYELHHGISLPEDPPVFDLRLVERDIYGSSHVGTETVNQTIASGNPSHVNIDISYTRTVGDKRYELSNLSIAIGIGNVLEVVTDRKLQVETAIGSGILDYYSADVVSQSDYYPFGMLLPNTNIDPSDGNVIEEDNDYRYAFNGMEKDDEVRGVKGASYTTFFRQYDSRIGRWLSLDPEMKNITYQSPYVAFDDNPIYFADPTGDISEGEGDKTFKTHTVSDGETLYGIARSQLPPGASHEDISSYVKKIQDWNGLKGTVIKPGQILKVATVVEKKQKESSVDAYFKSVSAELEDEVTYIDPITQSEVTTKFKETIYGQFKEVALERLKNEWEVNKESLKAGSKGAYSEEDFLKMAKLNIDGRYVLIGISYLDLNWETLDKDQKIELINHFSVTLLANDDVKPYGDFFWGDTRGKLIENGGEQYRTSDVLKTHGWIKALNIPQ